MDSLTQLALGAGVGAAVLGRRIGPRRAALAGAVLGTLPDLDVFWPFEDPIDAFVLHRGATHSLLVQALATPVLAEVVMRLFAGLRGQRPLVWAAVYLILATHALLDAFTVYGTRLLWPLSDHPFGVGSVFIIDPLYTLPLLVALGWAMSVPAWTPRFGRVLVATLALSTLYLGWSVAAQRLAEARAGEALVRVGIVPERTLATPTPFNTLLWRVIAVDGGRYLNLYVPLLGGPETISAYAHPIRPAEPGCLAQIPTVDRMARFAHGFVRTERAGDRVIVSDLRMGLTPHYVFSFAAAEISGGIARPIPPQRVRAVRSIDGDIDWLIAGVTGRAAPRPLELASAVDLDRIALAARTATPATC